MEDIDGGLHPAVDGQSLDDEDDERRNTRFLVSSLRRQLSPTRTLKWPWAQSCANHVQHIERLSRATCCVPRGPKGQFSY